MKMDLSPVIWQKRNHNMVLRIHRIHRNRLNRLDLKFGHCLELGAPLWHDRKLPVWCLRSPAWRGWTRPHLKQERSNSTTWNRICRWPGGHLLGAIRSARSHTTPWNRLWLLCVLAHVLFWWLRLLETSNSTVSSARNNYHSTGPRQSVKSSLHLFFGLPEE